MAILDIGGKRVQVGDDFLKLAPDAQQAAVEEIAASIGGGAEAMGPKLSEMVKPSQGESALRGGMQGATFNFSDELQAALGVPVSSVLSGDFGKEYDSRVAQIRDREKAAQAANPGTYMLGELGGSLAVPIPGAAVAKGATMGAKMARGAAVGAGAGAVSGIGAGEGMADSADKAVTGAAIGGPFGAALAPVLKGAGYVANKAVGEPVRRAMGNVNAEQQAAQKVGEALRADQAAGRGMSEADWLAARQAGEPVMIADAGGPVTKELMRSSTNVSPEAHAILKEPIDARFATQTDRTGADLKQMGAGVPTQKRIDDLKDQAAKANAPLYKKAYAAGDRDIWSPDLQDIVNTDRGKRALQTAVKESRDYDIALGNRTNVRATKVEFDPDLGLVFKSDKSPAYPNLQLWDYTKRELDRMARTGDDIAGRLATRLREHLDEHVPAYLQARGSASKFFGERDAIEFAKKAAARRQMSDQEILYSLRKMNPAERQQFRDTFRTEFASYVEGVKNNRDIAETVYNSNKMQNRLRVALGPQDAKKLEARIYIETAMDEARKALGNSTTTRQLVSLGMISGGSGALTALSTGDIHDLGYGAMAGGAVRMAATRGNRKIAEHVAKLLASNDPKKLAELQNFAVQSPGHMETLRNLGRNLTVRAVADKAGERGGASQALGFRPATASDNPNEQREQGGQAQNQQNPGQFVPQGSAAINAIQRRMKGPEPMPRPVPMGIRG